MSRGYWNFDSYSENWPRGEEKMFTLKAQINEYRTQERENNYKLISREVNRDAGCYVDFYGCKGILCTAVIDIDDFYYVVMDEQRKLSYHSCCGGYEVIPPDEELSANFSVLNWLRDNDPESLLKIVNESIEKNEVIPISAIRVVETG